MIWSPVSLASEGRLAMKTTIDLPDDLANKAKALAARRRTTLRAVIEEGIRMRLRAERATARFELRDASVAGEGLQPEFRDADWAAIRRAAYEVRGG